MQPVTYLLQGKKVFRAYVRAVSVAQWPRIHGHIQTLIRRVLSSRQRISAEAESGLVRLLGRSRLSRFFITKPAPILLAEGG